jgi:uncharacterized protein YdhG (YjbR/CyaY superfamily)
MALTAVLIGILDSTHVSTLHHARAAGYSLRNASPHTRDVPKFDSIHDYLASLPADKRAVVEQIERRVLAVAPDATRVIRYDMPTWQVGGSSLVHAAAWKQHVSLYPMPAAGDPDLDRDLAPYAGAKGTLKFSYAEVDYDLIERAVRRLATTRS